MQPVTLLTMRLRGADLINIPAPTTSSSVTIDMANRWINEGVAEFFVAVVAVAGTKAYEKSRSIAMAGGVTDYPLPNDFYQLVLASVSLDSAGNTIFPLTEYSMQEEPYLLSSPPGNYGEPYRYRLLGKSAPDASDPGSIRVVPKASSGSTLMLQYVYGPPTLVNDGDTLDGFAGFDNYASVFFARRAVMRTQQRERAAELGVELDRMKANLQGAVRSRDAVMAPRVNRTRGETGGLGGWRSRGWR